MNNNIKTPSLSVVIPVFNEHKTIKQIFDRVYNNQIVSEIILVDDCSNFGSTLDRDPSAKTAPSGPQDGAVLITHQD